MAKAKAKAKVKTYNVDLDLDYNMSDAKVLAAADQYGVRARLKKRVGPAGGNPLWEFSGAADALRELVLKWYAGGDKYMAEDQLDMQSDMPPRLCKFH